MTKTLRAMLLVSVLIAAWSVPLPATASNPTGTRPAAATAATTPTLAQMIGQKLMVRMTGTTPTAALLGRVQRGEVGGVILFGANIVSGSQVLALTKKLQAAAKAGGQPKLLIAVDQEGGSIKRIPWVPPTLSPPQMGRDGRSSVAHAQGAATASALKTLGINIDLAPVADVPFSTSSFMYKAGRTWSFAAATTATLADAFASGLESKGVLPSMKHFPGIGFATEDTDSHVVTITASKISLQRGLVPYEKAIPHHIPMIMLSNATYTVYDPVNAAGWSAYISRTLLRTDLGFWGVSITDSLDGAAAARGLPVGDLAVKAAAAGTDMILTTGSEATTAAVYARILRDANHGLIIQGRLLSSYNRILTLKAGL